MSASLACIESVEESVFLSTFVSTFGMRRGGFYWIGLYGGREGWRWSNPRCAGSSFISWSENRAPIEWDAMRNKTHTTASHADSLTDLAADLAADSAVDFAEQCLVMSATGWLKVEACDWAGIQCLCELGAEELDEYRSSMQASHLRQEKRAQGLRMWVATIFGVGLGFPLVFDQRMQRIGQWVLSYIAVVAFKLSSSPLPSPLHDREPLRALAYHLGWVMLFAGFTPFVWESAWGDWGAAGLGQWPNYTPMGPFGAMLMLETGPASHFRVVSIMIGLMMLSVGLMSSLFVASITMQELAKSHDTSTRLQVTNVLTGGGSLSYERYMLSNEDEGLMKLIQGQPHLIFFAVSAVFETYFGISMLLSVYADERSSFLYSKCMGYGRTTAGVCGLLLLVLVLCFLSNHTGAMLVAALTQHPNGIGSLATAVAWLLFAFGATARNRAYWLGFVSNGLNAPTLVPLFSGDAEEQGPS